MHGVLLLFTFFLCWWRQNQRQQIRCKQQLLLVLASSEEILLAGIVTGRSSEIILVQHGQRMSLPIESRNSSALGCRKLEQIPWNLFPQIGQQCWLASTDNSGCLQYLQYFTMLRWYYVIIEGIKGECSQMLGQFDASIQVGQFQKCKVFFNFLWWQQWWPLRQKTF